MNNFLHQAKLFCKRNGSTILTSIGGVGVVITTVMAVNATPKALQNIDEAKKEKGEELTKLEIVKVAGSEYIPTIIVGAATVACIFGANVLNKRRQAALVSAYALVDSSFKQYKHKLKDIYGEEAHREIVEAIAVEKAEDVGVRAPGYVDNNVLFVDEQCGETRLFYDEYGDRFFEATLEQVIASEYHLNRNYVLRGYVTLNEFYDFLGIEPTDYGSEVGWNIESEFYWIDFDHYQTEIKGRKCIIISTPLAPDMEWQEYY